MTCKVPIRCVLLLYPMVFNGIAAGRAAQNALDRSSTTVQPSPVHDDLATLTISREKQAYKRGEPIRVTFVLTTGSRGAYLPDYFGDWITTCERGFSAVILTATGASADPTPRGCARSTIHSFDDTALTELPNYVHLAPRETRTWTATLDTTAINPGTYSILGAYLSHGYMIDEVSRLPQVNGLMVKGRVTARTLPVVIE